MRYSKMTVLFALFLALLPSGLSSCSSTTFMSSAKGPVKLALLSITERYLTAIVNQDQREIDRLVLWGEYGLSSGDISKSRQGIFASLERLKILQATKHREQAESPFKNFKVEDVLVDENDAQVLLSRADRELNVGLRWSGRSWLIIDDNIFGYSGYLNTIEKS